MKVKHIRLLEYTSGGKDLITLRIYVDFNGAELIMDYDLTPKGAGRLANDLMAKLVFVHLSDEFPVIKDGV